MLDDNGIDVNSSVDVDLFCGNFQVGLVSGGVHGVSSFLPLTVSMSDTLRDPRPLVEIFVI